MPGVGLSIPANRTAGSTKQLFARLGFEAANVAQVAIKLLQQRGVAPIPRRSADRAGPHSEMAQHESQG
jgi:hypothetical protein